MTAKRKRQLILLTAWVIGLAVVSLLDWPLVRLGADIKPTFRDTDYYNGLKVFGAFPLWLIFGLAVWLYESAGHKRFEKAVTERGLAIILSPIIAGVLDAGLKLLFRRERPDLQVGHYVFRPITEHTFAGGGLGLPSSHAAVTFAGMLTLARLYPPIRHLCFLLACGTAAQRIVSGAHFPSDTYVGAAVGYLSVLVTWYLHRRFGTGRLLTPRDHSPG